MKKFILEIPTDKTLMFNYASGIISDNGVDIDNVKELTGIAIEEMGCERYEFPEVRVKCSSSVETIVSDEKGNVRVGAEKRGNGEVIVNTKPYMSSSELRFITDRAGCHAYVPSGNTVYGDNRFVGVFTSKTNGIDCDVNMREKGDYVDLVSGKTYENTDKIPLKLDPKSAAFLLRK
jgi:hypothetical protein